MFKCLDDEKQENYDNDELVKTFLKPIANELEDTYTALKSIEMYFSELKDRIKNGIEVDSHLYNEEAEKVLFCYQQLIEGMLKLMSDDLVKDYCFFSMIPYFPATSKKLALKMDDEDDQIIKDKLGNIIYSFSFSPIKSKVFFDVHNDGERLTKISNVRFSLQEKEKKENE